MNHSLLSRETNFVSLNMSRRNRELFAFFLKPLVGLIKYLFNAYGKTVELNAVSHCLFSVC